MKAKKYRIDVKETRKELQFRYAAAASGTEEYVSQTKVVAMLRRTIAKSPKYRALYVL